MLRSLVLAAYDSYAVTIISHSPAQQYYQNWVNSPRVGDTVMEISTIAFPKYDSIRIGTWECDRTTPAYDEDGLPYNVTVSVLRHADGSTTDWNNHQLIRLPMTITDGRLQ
jgi:hypothetical protein